MTGAASPGRCFAWALLAVRNCGGVLEHPAHSLAWAHHSIAAPPLAGGWIPSNPRDDGGWTCHVEQGHYGHPARKATWLYCNSKNKAADLIWGPSPQRLPAKRLAERGYESARRCGVVANMSTKQRQRTPLAFRDVLLSIARSCQ